MQALCRAASILESSFHSIIKFFNYVSAFLILLVSAWIVADVTGRVVFNHPLLGTPEVAANSLAAIAFLQMPFVLWQRQHVRSEMIVERLGPKPRAAMDLLANFLGLILFVLAFVASWEPTWISWAIGEYEGEGALRVPSYPTKTVILIASALMAVQFAANCYGAVRRVARGRQLEA